MEGDRSVHDDRDWDFDSGDLPPETPAGHDVRNLLTGIAGCADLALSALGVGHPARRYVLAIKAYALRGTGAGSSAPGEIPVAAGRLAVGAHSNGCTAPAPRTSSPPTVLVVEDDPLVRLSVCGYLERRDYRVLAADDGERAIAMLQGDGVAVDVLLVDLNLPGGTNWADVAEAARAAGRRLGVVYMSAVPAARLLGKDRLRGVRVLRKPFAEQELLDAIGRACAGEFCSPSEPRDG